MGDSKSYNRSINLYINGKEIPNQVASIRKELFQLQNDQADLTIGEEKYIEKGKDIRKLKSVLLEHQNSIRTTQSVWYKIKEAIPTISVAAFGAAIVSASKELYNLNIKMEADGRRASIVFGDSLGYVEDKADELSKKMGVTNNQFIAMATSTADLLVPLGFTRQRSAEMSVELQSLTGALDEWTGGSIGATEVSNILTKAILGENEGLKQLGVAIRMDSDEYKDLIKQKMEVEGTTTAQAQAMATLELIQRKTIDAQTAYMEDGNKLLRLQKSIVAGWQSWKEGLVELMMEDETDKLRNQGEMVNRLTGELYNYNTTHERRLEIVSQLNALAPEIVKSLDSELKVTESTRDALAQYNKELINKIMLQAREEELQKAAEKAAAVNNRNWDYEQYIINNINAAMARFGEYSDEMNSIMSENIPLYEQLLKLQDLAQKSSGTDKLISGENIFDVGALIQTFDNVYDRADALQEKVNEITAARDKMASEFGLNPSSGGTGSASASSAATGGGATEDSPVSESDVDGAAGEIWQTGQELKALMDDALKYRLESYDTAQEEMEAIAAQEIEKQAEMAEAAEDRYAAAAQAAADSAKKELSIQTTLSQKEQKLLEIRTNAYSEYAAVAGEVVGNMLTSQETNASEVAIQLIDIASNQLKALAALYIAELTAKNISQGVVGAIKIAAGTAAIMLAINVATSTAKGLVKSAASKREKGGYAVGGYTPGGDKYSPVGIVHAGEWVASSEMVASPVTGPIIRALEGSRVAGTYATGGTVAGGQRGSQAAAGQTTIVSSDPQLRETLAGINNMLVKLDAEGVKNIMPWQDIKNLNKAITRLEEMEGKVSM